MHSNRTYLTFVLTGLIALGGFSIPNASAERVAPDRKTAAPTKKTIVTTTTTTKTNDTEEFDYYPPWIGASLKIGTLGPGVEVTIGVIESYLNLRVGGNYLPLRFNTTIRDVEYKVDVKWASVPMLVDWHPFGNNFRISGGALYNRNRGTLDAKLNNVQKIGEHYYTPEEIGTLSGTVNFKNFGPYVGIGFGNAVDGPDTYLNFVFDLGVVFQGTPSIGLSADGTKSQDETFIADLQEEKNDVQEQADNFRLYPVLSFGISYQF